MASIAECIKEPLQKMNLEEKGLLNIILTYGKNANDVFKDRLKDPTVLTEWANKTTGDEKEIARKLNGYFTGGLGIGDWWHGRSENYGIQLEYIIDKVLIKALKVSKPIFDSDVNTTQGAIDREQWITVKILDSIWNKMPEEIKKEIIQITEKLLKEKGVDKAKISQVSGAMLFGTFTATKAILGFQFHIILAKVSNLIVKALIGRGLSVVGNALLQRIAAVIFGPAGWIITGILLIPTLFPRELDKYIPAVFLIGMVRLRKDEKQKEKRNGGNSGNGVKFLS
ncbi:MAG: hypothetical protein ABIK31_00240 [candidate division WOR-3 bacterium]